jgi:hypothetical protein
MVQEPQAIKRTREAGDTPVARKAPTVTSTDQVEHNCYLTLEPFGPSMGQENKPAQALAILQAFSKALLPVCASAPIIPRRGQARHRGLHCFYGYTETEAELVVSEVRVVEFNFEGVDCAYTLGWKREKTPERKQATTSYADRIARQLELKERDWSSSAPAERDSSSVHVIVFAQEGWCFYHVTLKQVKVSFSKMGLTVLNSSRPATKYEDQIIDGTQHETMHFNIIGITSETKWPEFLEVDVEHQETEFISGHVTIDLEYNILDEGLEKVMCTKGDCHGPIDMSTGLCDCKRLASLTNENYKDMIARKAGAPRGAPRENKPASGACMFLASMSIELGSVLCRHVTAGKCWGAVEGKKCQFLHPPADIVATIKCKLRRSHASTLVCQNGPKCLYDHAHTQRKPKALAFGEASSSC